MKQGVLVCVVKGPFFLPIIIYMQVSRMNLQAGTRVEISGGMPLLSVIFVLFFFYNNIPSSSSSSSLSSSSCSVNRTPDAADASSAVTLDSVTCAQFWNDGSLDRFFDHCLYGRSVRSCAKTVAGANPHCLQRRP